MIFIEQDVRSLRPVYNDDFFVLSSSNVTEPNFQYVCDVYVGTDYITRVKTFPNQTNLAGLFNVKRIVENYVNSDFNVNTNTFATNDNSYTKYKLKFGEEFGATSSGTTIYPNQVETSFKYCWNSVFDYEDDIDFNINDYTLNNSSASFLTNSPSTLNIGTDENAWLYGITLSSGDVYFMNVRTYDSSDNLIDYYLIANPYQSISNDQSQFIRVGTGTTNLNAFTSGTISYSLNNIFPLIGSNVSYYKVRMLKWNTALTTSEEKRYNVQDLCTRTEVVRLHFLNKLGGYDSFSFKNKTKSSISIKRSDYKSPQGEYTASDRFSYLRTQRGITTFDTNIEDTITLVSDWITEDEALWLEELLTSPDVLLDRYTNKHDGVPVNITESSYDIKKTALNKLINITINIQYSYKRYRQRF